MWQVPPRKFGQMCRGMEEILAIPVFKLVIVKHGLPFRFRRRAAGGHEWSRLHALDRKGPT